MESQGIQGKSQGIHGKSRENFREFQRKVQGKSQGIVVQGISGKVSGNSRESTRHFRESTGNFREFQGIPWNFREFQGTPGNFREFQGKFREFQGKYMGFQGISGKSTENFGQSTGDLAGNDLGIPVNPGGSENSRTILSLSGEHCDYLKDKGGQRPVGILDAVIFPPRQHIGSFLGQRSDATQAITGEFLVGVQEHESGESIILHVQGMPVSRAPTNP